MAKVKTKTSRKESRKSTTCKEPIQCPHEHFRSEVPDRRGLARDKHINILATPKGYHWEDVEREGGDDGKQAKKTPIQRRSCPDKPAKKPEKAYVHNFLAEVWSFLTPEMAGRLKNMLMNEFSMSSKDAEEFIFKQREANIINSSTVSMYKKQRDIGGGKVVLDSVIRLRTPNKKYCDKFPKSNIGIRNSWIKDFSDLISDKMADYVLDTMTAERTERQQEIAQNLLNRFNTLLEQKASLANPKTQTHKTMVLVADRLSLWLDKNVPMSKETAQRLKDIEEAQERKKLEEEKRKQMKEKQKPTAEGVGKEGGPESEEEDEQRGEGDQGPGGPPGAPGAQPGEPGAKPGESEVKPGEPGAKPGEPGVKPEGKLGEPGAEPEEQEAQPGEPGAEPEEQEAQPGEAGALPEEPGAQPGEAEAKPGEGETQPGTAEAEPREPGTQPEEPGPTPEAPEDGGTKAAGEEERVGSEETQPKDGTKPGSPGKEPGKVEEDAGRDEKAGQPEKTDEEIPEQADGTRPVKADETQPGMSEAVYEQKGKDDGDQISPADLAEEAKGSDQTAGEREEHSRDVPPSTDTQAGKTEETQPAPADDGKTMGESKLDENKDVEPTSAQPEPPPSDDEIQPTPSEIQQQALQEAAREDQPQGTTSQGETDQNITAGDEPPSGVPGETPESAPLRSEEKIAPTEPGATPWKGEETAPGADDEKFYEPSDKPTGREWEPADQRADEPAPQVRTTPTDGEEPTTIAGEEPTSKPGEKLSSPTAAEELTPEQQRQLEVIQAVASKILETPVEDTPRQEAIKDVLEKQLEKELVDDEKSAIDQAASKFGTWIDKMVEQVENEYGDRERRTPSGVPSEHGHRRLPPVSQKPKGSIFVVRKVDDRGYDVDLISNTRAQEKIRMARGKSPARAEVPNPNLALEPADLKNWAQWASAVSDMAQSWAEWIENTVQEAQKRGELLQTDDSPERLKEWDEFRGTKAQGAQQWRKTKQEVDRTANLWRQKGMKARELRKTQTD